jgi:SNF2 family DNA or RNA helicase
MQTQDRLVKIGKKEPILIIHLVVADSLELDIVDSLQRKEAQSNLIRRIVNGLKKVA